MTNLVDEDAAKANRDRLEQLRKREAQQHEIVPSIVPQNTTLLKLAALSDAAQKKLAAALALAEKTEGKPNAFSPEEEIFFEAVEIHVLRDLIKSWVESLKTQPHDSFRHGVVTGLLEFDRYLEYLDKRFNKYAHEVGTE